MGVGDIGIISGDGHAFGVLLGVVGALWLRVGGVGNIYYLQTGQAVGHVGIGVTLRVTCGNSHAMGLSRRVVDACLLRVGGIRDVYYPQSAAGIGDIGIIPGDGDILEYVPIS